MSEIKKTKTYGYCFGVKKAMDSLNNEILKNENIPIYTLGPIIHNDNINNELREKNVIIEDDINKIPGNSKVFIRSHGVIPEIIEELNDKNCIIFDATCPKVKVLHKIAEETEHLLIAGDKNHPEVVGIVGWAKNKVIVVNSIEELKQSMAELEQNKFTFVAQTTYNKNRWEEMKEFLSKNSINVEIKNTICNSTSSRQEEVENLAKESDFFIVIGGKNSSNTNKLFEIASEFCEALYIENIKELPAHLCERYKKIGLSSGASTPAEAVEEVIISMINENEKAVQDQDLAEDIDFATALEATIKIVRNGQRITGVVSAINGTEVQVDLGGKHSGFIPYVEFADDEEPVKVGDEIDAFVVKVNDSEGTVLLSKKKIDAIRNFEKIETAKDNKEVVKGKVTEVVKGGLVVNVSGVRVFVPGSLVSLRRNTNLEDFAGKEVKMHIISTEDGKRRKIVGSMRSVLAEAKDEAAKELWETIEEGKQYTGKVTSVTTFGAFVDIGGADGLVHISDMSWSKVRSVADFVKVGDEVTVTVKSFNPETKKISLSMKDLSQDPWTLIKSTHNVGDVIDVKVLKIMPYGAFVSVIPGIDGLIHISQLADSHVENVADYLSVGQTVAAKLVDINYDTKKVSLSIKGIAGGNIPADPEEDSNVTAEIQEETPMEEVTVEVSEAEEPVSVIEEQKVEEVEETADTSEPEAE